MSGSTIARRLIRHGLVALSIIGLPTWGVLLGPAPAAHAGQVRSAQPATAGGERITSYHVDFTIHKAGAVSVRETIDYDFGANSKHGIVRRLPYAVRVDDERYRNYDITGITASSPDGSPSNLEVTEEGDERVIRIGDPNQTVTGRHTYAITYELTNALTPHSGHDELYWNAIGDAWQVPISDVEVQVVSPAPVTGATCYTGVTGSRTPCASADPEGTRARFTQPSLDAGNGLTVAVKLPKGAVTVPPPEYSEAGGFGGLLPNSVVMAVKIIFIAIPLALVPLVFLLARPRRSRLPASGLAPQTTPPEGVRPGPAGALLAGRVGSHHVVATLVDLAARGYLRIEEETATGDWRFVRGRNPDAGLAPYEWTLLSTLFRGRDSVELRTLKYNFAGAMSSARRQIMRDVLRSGWYRRRPDTQRWVLSFLGGLFLLIGWGTTSLVSWAVAAAYLAGGLAIVVIGQTMTPITAAGDDLRRRVQGLRTHLSMHPVQPAAGDPQAAAEAIGTELPYAIALGVADGWARRFAELGAGPLPVGWYSGRSLPGDPRFAASVHTFTHTAGATMSASASSSYGGGGSSFGGGSSGFSGGSSGGGGGGGGGGSW
jgi:hypothetical protein